MPPLCQETQSLGQQMLKEPLGINGLNKNTHPPKQVPRVNALVPLHESFPFRGVGALRTGVEQGPGRLRGENILLLLNIT